MDKDGRSEYGTLYATSIAEVVERCGRRLPDLQRADRKQLFVNEYRHRLEEKHGLWDLKSVGGRQIDNRAGRESIFLDEMYVPLRFASSSDFENLGKGTTLTPDALLKREQALAIKGMAGSGKTTWVRWTYRRLMREPRALPIMVELRKLARSWSLASTGKDRSLLAHLNDLLAEIDLEGFEKELGEILKDPPKDLTPVLLVDGWDELGSFGDDLREKLLTFTKSNRKVVVVVTSRPYGHARPSHSDNFEELEVQPLSDSDVRTFAANFYKRCGAADSSVNDLNDFLADLKRSREAQNLTRTPLLLTMMLIVSRSGGLSGRAQPVGSASPSANRSRAASIIGPMGSGCSWRSHSSVTIRVAAVIAAATSRG